MKKVILLPLLLAGFLAFAQESDLFISVKKSLPITVEPDSIFFTGNETLSFKIRHIPSTWGGLPQSLGGFIQNAFGLNYDIHAEGNGNMTITCSLNRDSVDLADIKSRARFGETKTSSGALYMGKISFAFSESDISYDSLTDLQKQMVTVTCYLIPPSGWDKPSGSGGSYQQRNAEKLQIKYSQANKTQ